MLEALGQGLTLWQPAPGLTIHADRDSWYTSAACRTRIGQADALPSFSRPGNPYKNALPSTTQAEAGRSILKIELLPSSSPFASLEKLRLKVA